MAQRQTPGGQGPARRAGLSGRVAGGGRSASGRGPTAARAAGAGRGGALPDRSAAGRPAAGRGGELARSATRPAAARRAAVTGAVRTGAPQPRRLTGRATVLGLLLVGLLLAYAYPVRVYLSQQAEIAQLEAAQDAQRERIEALTEQRAKWSDPEYVKAQARKRFHLVERGDRTYIVIFDPQGAARDARGPAVPADTTPWYGRLWSSLDEANRS
ncbi:MAG TPA: septum formation initiator family protein [Micromonosporaceae bacterium]|nr:septum formation initiator family protein [Micromonosporaceae bacterium]